MAGLLSVACAAACFSGKPHVALIVVDDFGWANIGYHNPANPEVVTPNIDSLVAQGVKLERHYAYKFCSPTRSSLQSGRLPVHVNDKNADPTTRHKADPVGGYAGIPVNMTGIAQKMRQAGYRTHATGKWDVGMATPRHSPAGRGYESWLGYFHHANDYYTQKVPFEASGLDICLNEFRDLWYSDTSKANGPALACNDTSVYEEEYFTKNSLNVINNHNVSEPLFLFHAFHLVHFPLEVPDDYLQQFDFITNSPKQRKPLSAMVKYMDDVMGKMVDAFKARGMWDDLLIVFMSDNGGPIFYLGGANNWPLKGGKFSDWEGGVRVNAFVSGGYVPENVRGKTNDNYVHVADWYTTLCAIAGVDHTDTEAVGAGLPAVDGVDVWADITKTAQAPARTQMHLSTEAMIDGDYKVVIGEQPMSGWTPQVYPREFYPQPQYKLVPVDHWPQDCSSGCLFNIKEDPNERYNLAVQQADKLQEMMAKLAELNKSYYNPDRGTGELVACYVARETYGGYYGPFVDI
eukprot:TRINITY_DN3848_c0_g1_i6.p1 TRINITY_DN3848_c0_g1~~TRINITY_DN3848_c0_g1_i6.p1  ORF type:complete len:518 (+),score=221.64 TRINITY_DN3848_c0_g1_i6:80-1633(+)